jgi:hypothetical protein
MVGVWTRPIRGLVGFACGLLAIPAARAQDAAVTLRAGAATSAVRIDGRLDEPDWGHADAIESLTMLEPVEGAAASHPTRVRVLADARALVFGIECHDDPAGIVSHSKHRDANIVVEDHVAIVLGPFRDDRSGYVFAVNPLGARYDSLIAPGGEEDNPNWDGIWEAGVTRHGAGWTVELRIPIQTLSFKRGLTVWQFNVQRRIERLQETDRWAGARRDYELLQMSRAGLLAGLPEFDLGLGLTVQPSLVGGGGVPAPGVPREGDLEPSLDVQQRLGPNLLASVTVNTDFAETEVDERQTNLTRFPLFFPEKRTFFLEGSDIFEFGLGLGEDVIPFFSRRVGLVEGREVPLVVGGKLNGRIGGSNVGALVTRTGAVDELVPAETGRPVPEATQAVARLKQNVGAESWVGLIGTAGDPLGRHDSWTAGVDATYQTSRFRGDKNFLVGLWALAMDREDLAGDRTAWGLKVDYPNDLWDVALTYKRLGESFDPSLGFVPRRGVQIATASATFAPRPGTWIRQMFYRLEPRAVLDLDGTWESYEVFGSPVSLELDSGDRVETNVLWSGERLVDPFEIAEGVIIQPGRYEWRRHEIEVGSAAKRRLQAEVSWWFGGFYDGDLDEIRIDLRWSPSALLTLELAAERNAGRLPAGDFTQDLLGVRVNVNVTPDLTISSFAQYDNLTETIGANTRLRWTFRPEGTLFVIYNHNVRDVGDGWGLDSNQVLVKVRYAFRL